MDLFYGLWSIIFCRFSIILGLGEGWILIADTVHSWWKILEGTRVCSSVSSVQWWDSLGCELLNISIHTSFSNILLVMLVMVLLFSKGWVLSFWVRSIWNEWV